MMMKNIFKILLIQRGVGCLNKLGFVVILSNINNKM